MSVTEGPNSTLITSAHVNAVSTVGGEIITQGDVGYEGGYYIKFRHDNGGCGGPESGIYVQLKDFISWKYITFEWLGTGSAACWSFSDYSSNFGVPALGIAYLLGYDESLGDCVNRSYLSWEVSAYQSHNKTVACDNDANNFFRFNGDVYRSFYMKRRRNVNGSLSGVHHGRSCNSTGYFTIIRNIVVW